MVSIYIMTTIHTTYTNDSENNFYNILLETYEKSIRFNMSNSNIIKDELIIGKNKKPKLPSSKLFPHRIISKEYYKTPIYKLKIEYQKDIVNKTNDNIILSDCDMLMLNSVEDVFNLDFDIAFTTRENLFLNTGIIFIKSPGEKIKEFFEKWNEKVNYLYRNPDKLEKNKKRFTNGLNQCSLGLILEEYENKNKKNLKIKYLPSSIYNSCQDTWETLNDETRIVHIKSELRDSLKLVLDGKENIENIEPKYLQPIIEKWFEYYNIS